MLTVDIIDGGWNTEVLPKFEELLRQQPDIQLAGDFIGPVTPEYPGPKVDVGIVTSVNDGRQGDLTEPVIRHFFIEKGIPYILVGGSDEPDVHEGAGLHLDYNDFRSEIYLDRPVKTPQMEQILEFVRGTKAETKE